MTSRFMRRLDEFPAPLNFRARFPTVAFSRMNCWMLCPPRGYGRGLCRKYRRISKRTGYSCRCGWKSVMPAPGYFEEQGIALEEGQQAEVCFEACDWIENAGRILERGFVLTIDYGHEARILYDQHHNRGTLLAYRDHAVSENLFAAPGEQDLTSHVNFTALDLWGRRVGLERSGLATNLFLLRWAARMSSPICMEPGQTPSQSEVEKLHAAPAENLIHPEGMGEGFQVLIQHKGIEAPQLTRVVRVETRAGFSLRGFCSCKVEPSWAEQQSLAPCHFQRGRLPGNLPITLGAEKKSGSLASLGMTKVLSAITGPAPHRNRDLPDSLSFLHRIFQLRLAPRLCRRQSAIFTVFVYGACSRPGCPRKCGPDITCGHTSGPFGSQVERRRQACHRKRLLAAA